MIKNQKHAIYFALIAIFLWSTVATAFKLALQQLTPLQLVFYASSFSWLFLLSCLIKTKDFDQVMPTFKRNKIHYLKLGSLNPFLYYLILFKAYDLLPAQQAQALNYTWAIALSLLAVPMLGQKLRKTDIVALSFAYFGVLIISTKGEFTQLNFQSPLGVGLALLSTLLWALYWIYSTKNKDKPILSLFICFSIALPLISAVMTWQHAWLIPNLKGTLAALYVGLFEMGITFVLWLMAMKKAVNTAKVSNLIFISPFISLILINQFLGEEIHSATLIGLLFIVTGLMVQKLVK
ncbi:DMT family transporter [Pseudoalteromonas denitrificans]|uniref:Permease of the drug/metabolite transporter (DMT) superfamily n=1 Tax=Pseudoalteromonas denitrificans DSM 6059 TaxID=1123010 RepID=A0A1I1DXR9_9GAMM|nr:DMT family transporter [Pseudoalteromonas denitrificans]SFB77500.1 Permease of the drug/metabolite transporter (DMT) superfamily [Pseudoalteromonas denitrificans DSM 6059]